MILKFLDQKIRRAFSDSAIQYDVLAGLQKEIGRDLLARIPEEKTCGRILDIGMGTGYLTNKLCALFPEAHVVGIDFAAGMVASARRKYEGLTIIQGDAQALPFGAKVFDLAVSNLAYQWVVDLPAALKGVSGILQREGQLHATVFGHGTLSELFEALAHALPQEKGGAPAVLRQMPFKMDVIEALQASGFRDFDVKSESIKTHFPDMFALLKWLKDIGANTPMAPVFLGKSTLARASEYYREKFNDQWGVYATFEVLWINATRS